MLNLRPMESPRSLHVLHVMPSVASAYGGPTRALMGYLRAAKLAGVGVSVAAPRPPQGEAEALRRSVPEASWHFFRGVGRGAFVASPGLWAWLSCSDRTFDLIHVHGLLNPISSVSARLAIRHGVPVVIRPFGTLSRYTFEYRRSVWKHLYFRTLDRSNLTRAGALHFTSDAEREEARWTGITFDDRARVVPIPWFEVKRRSTEENPYIPFRAVSISRLHPAKNIDGLLQAWRSVVDSNSAATLIVAGSGPVAYVRHLKGLAAKLGLEESVSFAGFVTGRRKDTLLRGARVAIIPSHHENFGITVLEGMAAGTPVVVSSQVHLCSFVRRHHLGVVVERTPESLARGIIEAMSDDALQGHCRTSGPAIVQRYFSPGAVATPLYEMYSTSVANGKP